MGQFADQLRQTELFGQLSDNHLEIIESLSRSGKIAPGKCLIHEDDVGQSIYLILHGRVDVKISIPDSEHSEVIATLKDGDIVGELILLGRTRRSANVTAKDEVKALVWNANELNEALIANHEMGYLVMKNLARLLANRLATTNIALRNMLTAPKTIML